MDKKAPEKKQRLLDALDRGMVMIHLDARRPGVLVPESLRDEFHLRLNLSYRFDPPDLTVGEWGVRCTLSFGGRRFKVGVPWSALFAITSHVTQEFWMYPDDMPAEVIQQSLAAAKKHAEEEAAGQRPADEQKDKPAAILREVAFERVEKDCETPADDGPKPRGRGHLRVVK
jgi:stringent starvation protein B